VQAGQVKGGRSDQPWPGGRGERRPVSGGSLLPPQRDAAAAPRAARATARGPPGAAGPHALGLGTPDAGLPQRRERRGAGPARVRALARERPRDEERGRASDDPGPRVPPDRRRAPAGRTAEGRGWGWGWGGEASGSPSARIDMTHADGDE